MPSSVEGKRKEENMSFLRDGPGQRQTSQQQQLTNRRHGPFGQWLVLHPQKSSIGHLQSAVNRPQKAVHRQSSAGDRRARGRSLQPRAVAGRIGSDGGSPPRVRPGGSPGSSARRPPEPDTLGPPYNPPGLRTPPFEGPHSKPQTDCAIRSVQTSGGGHGLPLLWGGRGGGGRNGSLGSSA